MFTTSRLITIALCAALNFAIGAIVYLVKLPIYLDAIGTILCALLLSSDRWTSFVCATITGLISVALIGLLVNPFYPWFALTMVSIAAVSAFLTTSGSDVFRARPAQPGSFAIRVILYGVVTGIVAAVVSAPVVAYLFGGVTGSGSAFIVALFLKSGQQLMNATLLAGLASDPLDKIIQVLIATLLYRGTPADFLALVRGTETPARA